MNDPASEPEPVKTAGEQRVEERTPGLPATLDPSGLPPELVAKISAQFYQGVIPHPDILRGYEDLVPGAAKQILDTANEQSHHRMHLERVTIESDSHRSWAGLGAGTVICLVVLAIARELILAGHALEGTLVSLSDLGGLVGVFVYGVRERRLERDEKKKVMEPVLGSDQASRTSRADAELRRKK